MVQLIQNFLFMDRIEEFEHKLTTYFYLHSKKILVLDDCYNDWLIDYFRKEDKPIDSLVTSYLTNSNLGTIGNKKRVFRLLQFLSFSRHQLVYKKDLLSQKYYVVKFQVKDFMGFIKIENKNY